MTHEDFRVTQIRLTGPDGKSISRSMSVEDAIAWLEKQSGYSRAQVAVTMELDKYLNQVNLQVLKAHEKARKDIQKDAEEFLDEVRNEVAVLLSDVKRVRQEMPTLLSMVHAIEYDRRAKSEEEARARRRKTILDGLRVEMAFPGRKCGTCASLLSEKGIAWSPSYSSYLCASCGKQVSGEKYVVEPGDGLPAVPRLADKKGEEE